MVVTFSGGEVFTRPDLFDILEKVNSLDMRFALTTNGTLITESIAKELKRLKLLVARISVDGDNAEDHDYFRGVKGAFEKTHQGISYLIENKIPVTVLTTVTKFNYNKLENIIKKMIEWGVNAYNTSSFIPYGRGAIHNEYEIDSDIYKKTLYNLKKLKIKYQDKIDIHWHDTLSFLLDEEEKKEIRSCPAGTTMMEINPQGYVRPCISMEVSTENIREKKLKEIWESSKLFQTMRNLQLNGKCKECVYKIQCKGGCRAIAFNYTADINAPDPFCWHEQKLEG